MPPGFDEPDDYPGEQDKNHEAFRATDNVKKGQVFSGWNRACHGGAKKAGEKDSNKNDCNVRNFFRAVYEYQRNNIQNPMDGAIDRKCIDKKDYYYEKKRHHEQAGIRGQHFPDIHTMHSGIHNFPFLN
jgi:hypothetical protein